jgi:riboflavin synthase alpha subunit
MKKGQMVNIECDIIGKYVEKLVTGGGGKRDIRELIEKL